VILRPTTDVDAGATTLLGCLGTNNPSSKMPLGYDNAGISTSNTQTSEGSTVSTIYRTRIFKGFVNDGSSYTSLSINFYGSSPGWQGEGGGIGGVACAKYSLDNGASWTQMACDNFGSGGNGFGPALFSASLSSTQDVTKVQVGVCTEGTKQIKNGGTGSDSIVVNDIYLMGTVTAQSGGTGSSTGNAGRAVVVSN
jgi:hypothetical protein